MAILEYEQIVKLLDKQCEPEKWSTLRLQKHLKDWQSGQHTYIDSPKIVPKFSSWCQHYFWPQIKVYIGHPQYSPTVYDMSLDEIVKQTQCLQSKQYGGNWSVEFYNNDIVLLKEQNHSGALSSISCETVGTQNHLSSLSELPRIILKVYKAQIHLRNLLIPELKCAT